MGNQHSNGQHGHSHNGQPCHGHGPATQQQHGHSHGADNHGHSHGAQPQPQPQQPPQQHGHSHGGKACHGHGPAAQAPPPQQHGHSHGGKPCHGHGPAAAAQQNNHGHSHGQQQHGHSHGGKPCHGHGPGAGQQAAPQPTSPEQVEMMKKQKGVQLFMGQMFSPKVPIIWAHFHPNPKRDAKKETLSSGLKVPAVEGEVMNREEFRAFIEAFLTAQSRADGHTVVRVIEAMQTERQFLAQLAMKDAVNDPEVEIKLPYDKFKSIVSQLVMIIALRKYDTMKFLMEELGLGAMKLPNLPQMSTEVEEQRVKAYSREKIMPLLIQFVEDNANANKDDENKATASGFIACTASIKQGVTDYINHIKKTKLTKSDEETAPTEEELEKRWREYAEENAEEEGHLVAVSEEIENLQEQAIKHPDDVLGDLKIHPHADNFSSSLIAQQVQQLVVIPLLQQNPIALQFIAKQWSIDLHLQEITEEDGVIPAQ